MIRRRRLMYPLKPQAYYKKQLIGLTILAVLILTPFYFLARYQDTLAWGNHLVTQVMAKDRQLEVVTSQKSQLEVIAQVATASAQPVTLTDKQIKNILSIIMPSVSDQDHFMKILACEDSNHDPKRVHVNSNGLGYDLGVAQVNSVFHADRVKEFFGQDFNDAMSNPTTNLVYAVYLYQHQGFSPWVCNKYIK